MPSRRDPNPHSPLQKYPLPTPPAKAAVWALRIRRAPVNEFKAGEQAVAEFRCSAPELLELSFRAGLEPAHFGLRSIRSLHHRTRWISTDCACEKTTAPGNRRKELGTARFINPVRAAHPCLEPETSRVRGALPTSGANHETRSETAPWSGPPAESFEPCVSWQEVTLFFRHRHELIMALS